MRVSTYVFPVFFTILTCASPASADGGLADITDECSSPDPGWIWCDDFETDRSSDYFEGSADRQPETGISGSTGAAFHFTKGESSGGGIKIAFGRTPSSYFEPVDAGTQDYREIYWRMFVYVPEDWVGNGADKLSRATIMAADDWSQAMIAHVWSGKDPGDNAEYLLIDPASGTDPSGNLATSGYNDFDNLRWLGYKAGSFPVFASGNFGEWHCVEAHVELNDPGQGNGVFQLFINDELQTESTALNWVGSYDDYGINAVFFENYWNAGSPVDQTRYFDNLVISTEPIGCSTDPQAPMPPTILRVGE